MIMTNYWAKIQEKLAQLEITFAPYAFPNPKERNEV